jgi:hypothetical protein
MQIKRTGNPVACRIASIIPFLLQPRTHVSDLDERDSPEEQHILL